MKPKNPTELKADIRMYWKTLTLEVCRKFIRHLHKVIPKVIEVNGRPSGFKYMHVRYIMCHIILYVYHCVVLFYSVFVFCFFAFHTTATCMHCSVLYSFDVHLCTPLMLIIKDLTFQLLMEFDMFWLL